MKWLVLWSIILVLGCQPNQVAEKSRGDHTMPKPTLTPEQQLAPGTCRVIARVQSIDTGYQGKNTIDPCSRVPCRATIIIQKVEGCGSGSIQMPPINQPILAHFIPTLNPRIAFRGEKYADLAPLYVGKTFKGILEIPADAPQKSSLFYVRWYQVMATEGEN